ncbi:N-acetylglutamate synthase, mitochondrial-like [Ptychodera flava]|uniref:N-acetylglutamate synthase, mitochondrial-like n=1 Tax=Ptychodera flava TaxID=63121 RepID=UPI003969CFA8
MQILLSKKASLWHRRMHCLLLCTKEQVSGEAGLLRGLSVFVGRTLLYNIDLSGELISCSANKLLKRNLRVCCAVTNYRPLLTCWDQQGAPAAAPTVPGTRENPRKLSYSSTVASVRKVGALFRKECALYGETSALPCRQCTRGVFNVMQSGSASQHQNQFSPAQRMSRTAQDLKRFLEEFGTDPREARYWLKNFRRNTEHWKPFAVVQIDQEVFQKPEMMESVASSVSFLLRHDMKTILVHGNITPDGTTITSDSQQAGRSQLTAETMAMVNKLEEHGAPAYPFFSGGCVLRVKPRDGLGFGGKIVDINTEPLEWCLKSHHVPVVSSIGETESGQLLSVDACHATEEIAKVLTPLKVMFLNTTGGFHDADNHVIANVNLPADYEPLLRQRWCTRYMKYKVGRISKLLDRLPSPCSVVITSADTLLTELFTHRGSGTFFKNTEPIHVHRNLDNVSKERLVALLTRAFGKGLKDNYLDNLKGRLHTLYLSENYNACAVITQEQVTDIPYLDKFAVSAHSQGEGTSEMLWECVRRDFKSLFWRSRNTNMINPWYFKRSEGSWSNGNWTVFWYGISNPKISYELVDHAAALPSSFIDPPSQEDSEGQRTFKKTFLFR